MNYFELFDMPPVLKTDKAALKKKFFQLSREFHPDYHIQNDSDTQAAALESAAVLNRAYRILGNDQQTISYLLGLKGLLEENEKYALPPDFLMEMLELNEQVQEAGNDAAALERLLQQVKQVELEIYEPVSGIIADYREGHTSEKELLQVKEYYFKKKYLERLQQQML